MDISILDALKATTEQIRDWVNRTKADKTTVNSMSEKLDTMPNDLVVIGGKLYLAKDGTPIESSAIILPEGGGGGSGSGGGGSTSTAVTVTNKLSSTALITASGTPTNVVFYFSSTNEGDGTAHIFVTEGNNAKALKGSVKIKNGVDNTIDISSYIGDGTNIVDIVCSDRYGSEGSLRYTVNVIKLSITTAFSDSQVFTRETGIPISVYFEGNIRKTLHFKIKYSDNTIKDYVVNGITVNNTSVTYDILKIISDKGGSLSHGAYLIEVYTTSLMADGSELKSNSYIFDVMFSEGKTTPLISSIFNTTSITQGEQLNIPFTIYHVGNPKPEVTLSIEPSEQDGKKYLPDVRTVDNGVRQSWSTKNYPTGEVTFTISYSGVTKSHTLTVEPSEIKQQIRTDNMKFYISAEGKSNESVDYNVWNGIDDSNNIIATTEFNNVNWVVTNKKFTTTSTNENNEEVSTTTQYAIGTGWAVDQEGNTALRLSGEARAFIDFKPYAVDPKANGKTIELIFKINDVNNRDAVAMSCMSNGVGFEVTSDTTTFTNGSTSAVCKYIDGERIHITLVIEPQGTDENPNTRLFCAYLNGVMSSAAQYTTSEILHQSIPVGISVGSSECSIDLYAIRTYDIALTKEEVRDNFIADYGDVATSVENDIYSGSEMLLSEVEKRIPVMRITGELPSLKKDSNKKKGGRDFPITVVYTDNVNTDLSFNDSALIHVQGTSSEGYPRKNWKIEFDNEHQHMPGMIPSDVFCMKCDFAENTGSHNTGNANYVHTLYGDIKTPAQEADSRCRTTIAGFPCVIFHRKSNSDPYVFAGRYNFNYEKSSNSAYGLTEEYPDAESWEFRENGANACQFLEDIPEDVKLWNGPIFEARYPDGSEDISDFRVAHEWVVSTNRDAATGDELSEEYIDIDGITHTHDTAEYRLAKFKTEFEDHFDLDFSLVYYLYTFVILMVDQRAKNMFQSTWDGVHYQPWLYDNDTSFGINNEGKLVFDYYHQDYGENSKIGNQDVFNGGKSVLWTNFHEAFKNEIDTLYQSWRVSGNEKLSYEKMIKYFITDQTDRWSISMYNEDMEFKYIAALRNNNNPEYLYQVRGTGEEHFKYFVKNRLMFCDSKFFAGNFVADNNRVVLRINTPEVEKEEFKPNPVISYKTFSNMYATVRYGTNAKPIVRYTPKDTLVSLGENVSSNFKDTDTYIFGADQISYLDDLSLLYCSTLNISAASKLLELNVGRDEEGYKNPNLKGISFTNNRLLRKVNICNCNGFTQKVLDFTLCPDIQEILATGSNITGIDLPDSGYLKIAKLPDTIETLKIVNQKYIETFECENYKSLKSIRIENSVNVPIADILNAITDGNYPNIRIVNMDWNVASEEELSEIVDKAINCKALDASGLAVDSIAVITGKVYVDSTVSDELRTKVHQYFPDLVIVDKTGTAFYFIDYLDFNGEIYETELITDNEIPNGPKTNPNDIIYDDHRYIFKEWDMSKFKINQNNRIDAIYLWQYAVKYYNGDVLLTTKWGNKDEQAIDPVDYDGNIDKDKIAIPTKTGTEDLDYTFIGWGSSKESGVEEMPVVSGVTNLYAQYANIHPVRFYKTEDCSSLLYTQWVVEGEDAHDPIEVDGWYVPPEIIVSADEKKLVFSTWNNIPKNVSGICKVYATYDTYWMVTFYNESVIVDSQWVKNGENAINPINRSENPIDTPIKTSTAQYNFEFAGWDNLNNIIEPRKINALYTSVTRKYKVEFYNIIDHKEVLLWTQTDIQYGSDAKDPSKLSGYVKPVKSGVSDPENYEFIGWNPGYIDIKGDTKCYAMFKYKNYIKDDWATIAKNANDGKAEELYPIGACKEVTIDLNNMQYTFDVEVIAHNHDNLSDGSGVASLTFFCKTLPDIKRKMYQDGSNPNGWKDSDMRSFVNTNIYNALPTDLKDAIKSVIKISDGGANNKSTINTDDLCWLASLDEVGFSPGSFGSISGQGQQYSNVFSYGDGSNPTRIRYLNDGITMCRWWLRTSGYKGSANFIRIQASATTASMQGNAQIGTTYDNNVYVAFGFCV